MTCRDREARDGFGDPAERNNIITYAKTRYASARFSCIEGSVTSKDGTKIGYCRYGAGPAIVLVQGAIGTAHSYHELASDLASDFTIYVPERRGRPLSPRAFSSDHVIEREIEDLAAILERSGASFLFGLSSGAVIALEAARVLGTIRKLVLYEAPLYVPPERMRVDLVARLNREVEAGHIAAAMLTALAAAGTVPPFLEAIPRWPIEAAMALILRLEARRKQRNYPSLRELVPTMLYDFAVVSSMQNRLDTFRQVTSHVLLLSGTKSPSYLRRSPVALDGVLPTSRHIEFKGLGHSGPWNADRGGKPRVVAAAMRDFFNQSG